MAKGSSKTDDIPADIRKLSFEKALGDLEDLVQRLESGQVNLDDSIELYTRGTQLKQHCETKLRDAKERVDKIVLGAGGSVESEPAGID